jgi:hypothetical protein
VVPIRLAIATSLTDPVFASVATAIGGAQYHRARGRLTPLRPEP